MAAPRKREPSDFAEAVTFWSVVILISAIAAFISFRVGRDWLGKRLGDVEVSQGAPRIVAQAEMDAENAQRLEQEEKAPAKAAPVVEDREPTEAERRRFEREQAEKEPQDGAQANSGGSSDDDESDLSADRPEPDEPDSARDAGPTYTVTAGAFAERGSAQKVVAELRSSGFSPYIEEVTRNGKTLHRVCVGKVTGKTEAQDLQREVADMGLSAGLVAGG